MFEMYNEKENEFHSFGFKEAAFSSTREAIGELPYSEASPVRTRRLGRYSSPKMDESSILLKVDSSVQTSNDVHKSLLENKPLSRNAASQTVSFGANNFEGALILSTKAADAGSRIPKDSSLYRLLLLHCRLLIFQSSWGHTL